MSLPCKMPAGFRSLAALPLVLSAVFAGFGSAGEAATWTFLPEPRLSGTFEADAAGGPISNPQIVFNGILFDTPNALRPLAYNPDSIPPRAPDGYLALAGSTSYGYLTNSTGAAACPGLCSLGFDFNGTYGEYFADTDPVFDDEGRLVGSGEFALGAGEYQVAPIPLPAGLVLLLSGIAATALVGARKRRG